ncbi:MAG: hypothetical protein H6863_02535 [Rhodospirillales bacterium]|nr:hypothetical protein [Rhodospirillales bacterium]
MGKLAGLKSLVSWLPFFKGGAANAATTTGKLGTVAKVTGGVVAGGVGVAAVNGALSDNPNVAHAVEDGAKTGGRVVGAATGSVDGAHTEYDSQGNAIAHINEKEAEGLAGPRKWAAMLGIDVDSFRDILKNVIVAIASAISPAAGAYMMGKFENAKPYEALPDHNGNLSLAGSAEAHARTTAMATNAQQHNNNGLALASGQVPPSAGGGTGTENVSSPTSNQNAGGVVHRASNFADGLYRGIAGTFGAAVGAIGSTLNAFADTVGIDGKMGYDGDYKPFSGIMDTQKRYEETAVDGYYKLYGGSKPAQVDGMDKALNMAGDVAGGTIVAGGVTKLSTAFTRTGEVMSGVMARMAGDTVTFMPKSMGAPS